VLGEPGALWVHVGDDLAYDVGGSAQCGAKTVYVELADKYGQTVRHGFDPTSYKKSPSWSMSSQVLECEKACTGNDDITNNQPDGWTVVRRKDKKNVTGNTGTRSTGNNEKSCDTGKPGTGKMMSEDLNGGNTQAR
jgi:hypothetical protein